jgi:hypothetical protein
MFRLSMRQVFNHVCESKCCLNENNRCYVSIVLTTENIVSMQYRTLTCSMRIFNISLYIRNTFDFDVEIVFMIDLSRLIDYDMRHEGNDELPRAIFIFMT